MVSLLKGCLGHHGRWRQGGEGPILELMYLLQVPKEVQHVHLLFNTNLSMSFLCPYFVRWQSEVSSPKPLRVITYWLRSWATSASTQRARTGMAPNENDTEMAVSINFGGPCCGCTYNENPTALGSVVGPLIFGNSK